MDQEQFETALQSFFLGCQAITKEDNVRSITAHNKEGNADLPLTFHDVPWEIQRGKRYIRILRHRCIHCFVDTTNGDVLKAASWKTPAKHARGNIFDKSNGLGNMGAFGPHYLR